MYCAPRHVRVLRSPRTMSSHLYRVPRLRQNSEQFHDLEIFTAVWSCAPRGRPLQLYTRLQEYIMYSIQRKVQPEPGQLQHSPVGGRSRDSLVERRVNPMSTRRVTDATREQSRTHKRRNTGIHKGRKNKESRGVHPFVISNVLRTAARPRAALPSHNVQSSIPSPTT